MSRFVLDEDAHPRVDPFHAALVEVGEDLLLGSRDQIGRDPGLPGPLTSAVELAADHAEQRRVDLEVSILARVGWVLCRAAPGRDADDAGGNVLVHQVPPALEHHLLRLAAIHGLQAGAVVGEGGDVPLELFDVREVILPEAQDQLEGQLAEVESPRKFRALVQGLLEVLRGPVLDQVSELGEEFPCPAPGQIVFLPPREGLLELVEGEHRRDRAVPFVPEFGFGPMEVLPQRLRVGGWRGFDAQFPAFRQQSVEDLGAQRRAEAGEIETDVDRNKPFLAQHGEHAGVQKRGLAQSRATEQHRQRLAPEQTQHFGGLGVSAVEVFRVAFGKRVEARPGVLGVEARARSFRHRQAARCRR